jgi:hypothetical protein
MTSESQGSQWTLRWREQDSNPRSRFRHSPSWDRLLSSPRSFPASPSPKRNHPFATGNRGLESISLQRRVMQTRSALDRGVLLAHRSLPPFPDAGTTGRDLSSQRGAQRRSHRRNEGFELPVPPLEERHQKHDRRWGQRRQTTTDEVCLDHRKAASSGIGRRAIRRFGYEQRRFMIEFRCGGASMRRRITLAGQESGGCRL